MKFAKIGFFALGLAALAGCSNNTGTAKTNGALIEVSGRVDTGAGLSSVAAKIAGGLSVQAVGEYSINCVTLTSPAQAFSAGLGADGSFKISIPAKVGIGCFIVKNSDQSPVASVYVESDQKTMGANLSSSLNLQQDVNLGQLSLDLAKREVRIPKARISVATTKGEAAQFKLQDLNNETYTLKCVPTGNSLIDANCVQKLESDSDHNKVFFRVLQALQAGKSIHGLGVWESGQAFMDCGGIDLSAEDVQGAAQNDDITFPYADKISLGGEFNIDNILCPLRNPSGPITSWMNIRKYYALGGVDESEDGYTLHTESEDFGDQYCKILHKTIVHFSGKSAGKLNGQFYSSTTKTEYSPGACGNYTEKDDHFIIELTKQ